MKNNYWDTWSKNPKVEKTKLRVTNKLPTMECTKQLKKILEKIYKPKMKILDFGCASGHYYLELKKLDKDIKYTGFDATQNYINFAKKYFKKNKNINFKVKNLLSNNISSKEKFDIVYSCNVLLHLPEILKPIKNLLSLTNKYCIIRTLVDSHTHISKHLVKDNFDKKNEPTHYAFQNTYSYEYLKKIINRNGKYKIIFENDVYNKKIISNEYKSITKKTKDPDTTRISNNLQISGSKVFNWKWLIIKKK